MTEDEAKTKWCPMARHTSQIAKRDDGTYTTIVNANRDPLHVEEGGQSTVLMGCIGSGCMAWRWTASASVARFGGFCGLAGGRS